MIVGLVSPLIIFVLEQCLIDPGDTQFTPNSAYAQRLPQESTEPPAFSSTVLQSIEWGPLVIEQHNDASNQDIDTEMLDINHVVNLEYANFDTNPQVRLRPGRHLKSPASARRLREKLKAQRAELQKTKEALQSSKKESEDKDQKIQHLEARINALEKSPKRTSMHLQAEEDTNRGQSIQQSVGQDVMAVEQLNQTPTQHSTLPVVVHGCSYMHSPRSSSLTAFLPHRSATSSSGSHPSNSSRGNSPGPPRSAPPAVDAGRASAKEPCVVEKTGGFFKKILGRKPSKNSLKDSQPPESSTKFAAPPAPPIQHPAVQDLAGAYCIHVDQERESSDSGYASM